MLLWPIEFVLENFKTYPILSSAISAFIAGVISTFIYLRKKTFVVTFPMPHTHLWHKAKQSNGSINTQIIATLLLRNITNCPLGLSSARLIKPATKYNLIHNSLLIKSINTKYSGTTITSGYKIQPNDSSQVNLHLIYDGNLNRTNTKNKTLEATLGITADDGCEVIFSTIFNLN